jgi:ABC-type sugar transport system ATPase subunit
MVFQSYALYPHMTVYDNMAFALKIAGDDKEDRSTAKVRAAAEKLQLTNFLDRLPKALSGGQRQRVAIGRSIVRDPKVYLFDEPLSNLDAALRVATRIEIAQLKEQMPESTMIYVTHDQVEAMTLATRIVVLAGGGIAQVGSPLTLYEKPASTFVAQFIGSPAMNLLPGKIVGTGEVTTLELNDGGGTITSHYPSQARGHGRDRQVGIRPEDMVRPTATTTPSTARSTSSRRWARSRSFISTRRARITRPTPSSPSCMASTPTCADNDVRMNATRRPDRSRHRPHHRPAPATPAPPISTACAAWPRRGRAARICPAATRPTPMPRWGRQGRAGRRPGPNLGIVTAYNDMLSGASAVQGLPRPDQGGRAQRPRAASAPRRRSRAACRPCATASPKARRGWS